VTQSEPLKDTPDNMLAEQIAAIDLSELPRDKLLAIHNIIVDGTTKFCPKCLSTSLARFSSINLKRCTRCSLDIPWVLTKGQKRL
jgi:hypothetical protein